MGVVYVGMNGIKHVINGQEYTITVVHEENGVRVRTFREGKQVGLTYGATDEVAHQFNVTAAQITGIGILEALVNCARSDLDSGATK